MTLVVFSKALLRRHTGQGTFASGGLGGVDLVDRGILGAPRHRYILTGGTIRQDTDGDYFVKRS